MQTSYGIQQNLTKITWSHGTNSQKLLNEVLASDINFIEADIVYGYLKDDELREYRQPIMAHPPDEESDITLKTFLIQIWKHNANASENKQKGVKLDFKSTDVFQNSLPILKEMWNPNYRIWLNADIYSGPVNNTSTQPVDPTIFLEESKKFENVVLSTGWTTRYESNFSEGCYSNKHVETMLDGLKKHEIKNSITFPIRAGIAAHSIDTLTYLYTSLNETNLVTFTLWSSNGDNVDIEKLRKMIFHFGLDKIYIDVPESLSNQLRLHEEPHNETNHIKLNLCIMLIGLFLVYLSFITL